MDLDGIWKIEMLGIYDWETTATAFLENGRYLSGGGNHYSTGTYQLDGDRVIAEVTITNHDTTQVLFGKKSKIYKVRFQGKLEGNIIEGEAMEGVRHLMRYRATRVADLS